MGSYLGVHEGPQRISKLPNRVALEPGMIVSNEPGYYREGAYGIRIENLVAVVADGDMLGFEQVKQYIDKDVIEIVPLAFMRGRTLNHTYIILDEAQNTTVTQMKMFLTRMGEGSRVVVTGDVTQLDLPQHVHSGLIDAVQRLANIPGVAVVHLGKEDIVRHRLVARIVHAYEKDQETTRGKKRR